MNKFFGWFLGIGTAIVGVVIAGLSIAVKMLESKNRALENENASQKEVIKQKEDEIKAGQELEDDYNKEEEDERKKESEIQKETNVQDLIDKYNS